MPMTTPAPRACPDACSSACPPARFTGPRHLAPALGALLILGAAGCGPGTPDSRPHRATPYGSELPGTLGTPERDSGYYLDHDYVTEAMAHGNWAIFQLDNGNAEGAGKSFETSEKIMAEGIMRHVSEARDRQAGQDMLVDLLSVGLTVAGGLAAASIQDPAAAQRALSSVVDTTTSLSQFLKEEVVQRASDSTAVSAADSDAWRAMVISDSRIARSVVRLRDEDRGSYCSGAFIAPYVIMTAAHCIRQGSYITAWRQAPWEPDAFMAGVDAEIKLTNTLVSNRFDKSTNARYNETMGFDVAFALTESPSDVWLPVATRVAEPGETLLTLGYSGDLNRGFFLRADYGCEVTSIRANNVLANDCAVYGGNSGGPVLSTRDGLAILGVHSGGVSGAMRQRDSSFAASTLVAADLFRDTAQYPHWVARAPASPF